MVCATLTHSEAFLYEYSILPKTLSHTVFTFLGHYFLKIFKSFHMESGASNKLQNEGYSIQEGGQLYKTCYAVVIGYNMDPNTGVI